MAFPGGLPPIDFAGEFGARDSGASPITTGDDIQRIGGLRVGGSALPEWFAPVAVGVLVLGLGFLIVRR